MYVRVVRFTDVNAERLDSLLSEIDEREGPPEGIPSGRFRMLFDGSQGTAVVLQEFDSEDDMKTAAATLDAMDPSETPGTRVSVDMCEVKAEFGGN